MEDANKLKIPKVLQGYNVFIDGRGYAGKIGEVELPKLTIKTEEHQPGGFDAPIELDCGMEKLEMTATILDFDIHALRYFGLGHNNPIPITLRGAESYGDGSTLPIVVNVVGMWREVEQPKMSKPGKNEMKITASLTYYKLTAGGEVIHEIDVPNMVRIIDGTDYLAEARAAIGV